LKPLKKLSIDSWDKPKLITVKYNTEIHEFDTLDQAMTWAKELGEFVTIQFNGSEVVGKFGADGIDDGKFPDGKAYTWKKRRRN
jgi:hypothetical protein